MTVSCGGSTPAEFPTAWCNPVMEIDELLHRQDQLQAEAATVRQDLGLDQRLSTLGEVVPVGGAALGLMVWRDLDLTVVCRRLDAEAAAGAGALLAGHPRVREVRFIDDTGDWNTDLPRRAVPGAAVPQPGRGDLEGGHLVRR